LYSAHKGLCKNCAGITEVLTKYRKYGKIRILIIPYRICNYIRYKEIPNSQVEPLDLLVGVQILPGENVNSLLHK
jgi:hypothetical protein